MCVLLHAGLQQLNLPGSKGFPRSVCQTAACIVVVVGGGGGYRDRGRVAEKASKDASARQLFICWRMQRGRVGAGHKAMLRERNGRCPEQLVNVGALLGLLFTALCALDSRDKRYTKVLLNECIGEAKWTIFPF